MTPRQLAFVAAFTLTRNGTRAAVMAGFSPRTAAAAASRLRRHPEVAAAIAKLCGLAPAAAQSPLAFLLAVVNDPDASTPRRIRAATVAARYMHPRPGVGGKKEQQQVAAKSAGGGKFAPAAAPLRLVPRKDA